MDELLNLMMKLSSYPRFGEIRRYRVISEEDYDIVPKKSKLLQETKELEATIKRRTELMKAYVKQTEELEEELREKQLALKP